MSSRIRVAPAATILLLFAPFSPVALAERTDEEFVGPFASWLDVGRDFGAVGDGRADDTAALQRALDEIREHRRACVLYLPAGTYRLTQTLRTARKAHQDNMVTVVGEDPTRVVLRWDGPDGGTMFQWDAWYAKLSRLTLDGAKRAGTCLLYGPAFSTYNETSDVVFRDARHGLVLGTPGSSGQAENEVLRCRFERCGVGIQTVNWNSMDIGEKSPTVAVDNFRGLSTLATCILLPVDTRETCRFEIRGDGSRASVLALNDQFWVHKPGTTAETVWRRCRSKAQHTIQPDFAADFKALFGYPEDGWSVAGGVGKRKRDERRDRREYEAGKGRREQGRARGVKRGGLGRRDVCA